MRRLLAVAAVALGVAPGATAAVYHGEVVRDIDGDTIVVSIARARSVSAVHVRLLGVNTPETHDPRKPVECFGPEAARATAAFAPPGTPVVVRTEPSSGDVRDRYGRLLAYVTVRRIDLGVFLLAGGFARVYPYHDRRFAKRARYERVEAAARKLLIGLWGRCQ